MRLWTTERRDQIHAMLPLPGNPLKRRVHGDTDDAQLVWQYDHRPSRTSPRRPRQRMERLSISGR
jgi:hypothetical protein